MSGILGWAVAAALALAWWALARREAKDWRHLLELLTELSAGRVPENFVFRRGGRFALLTHPLDKLAEEQQRLREQRDHEAFSLRTILASMEEGVLVADAQHVLRLVNPSLIKLFELTCEPLGKTILRALREAAFEEMARQALSTGQPQSGEVMTNARPPRHYAVHVVPIHDQPSGAGVVMIVRDVSRLKQLEEVRREFVANVSHELRTPLSIFHGYVENLLDDPEMERAVQLEVFEILRKHSLRLNALLEDLLTIARLESRHEELNLVEIDLGKLMRSVGEDWKAKIRDRKLTLTVDAPETMPPLSADTLRLEQVLNNLLENAVKYTEPGGSIALRTTATEEAVEVRVEDTGRGIPPADLPHIFERFYRADKARSREQGGTGLGLSIVKHIVQQHGGTVIAESKYGIGTTIVLRLPLRPVSG